MLIRISYDRLMTATNLLHEYLALTLYTIINTKVFSRFVKDN